MSGIGDASASVVSCRVLVLMVWRCLRLLVVLMYGALSVSASEWECFVTRWLP